MPEEPTDRNSMADLAAAFIPLARKIASDPELRETVRKAAEAAGGAYKGVRSMRGGGAQVEEPAVPAGDEPHAPPTHGSWKMITPGVVAAGIFAAGIAAAVAAARHGRK
jgi:hypothetical protein